MTAGSIVLSTENRDFSVTENKNFLAFGGYPEDYLQFAPHVSLYAFEWAGMKPKPTSGTESAILAKSEILRFWEHFCLKKAIKKPRPDGSNEFGFPSGHTANVLLVLQCFLWNMAKITVRVPYVAYSVATGVGVLRIAHDKHYWSDVIFGAGIRSFIYPNRLLDASISMEQKIRKRQSHDFIQRTFASFENHKSKIRRSQNRQKIYFKIKNSTVFLSFRRNVKFQYSENLCKDSYANRRFDKVN